MKAWLAALLVVGCDAGEAVARKARVPRPIVAADAGSKTLFGTEPATLGPAFDGLALGQAIDQEAATAWLRQRGIDACAYVRAGHLASINVRVTPSEKEWPGARAGGDFEDHWFAPALHQHATELETEQGVFMQFDLEVPIDRWIDKTVGSVVRLDLVAKSLDVVDDDVHLVTHANSVDGRAHVTWVDSALAGAATATELSVREFHTYDHDREVVQSHDLYVELDAPPASFSAIEQRLVELFGKPTRSANAVKWKQPKLTLGHAQTGDIEHIALTIER